MKRNPELKVRRSLATRLLIVILAAFATVTVGLTAMQVAEEYVRAQRSIARELTTYGVSFTGGLSSALWNMDDHEVQVILAGMATIPEIVGVSVYEPDRPEQPLAAVGYVASRTGEVAYYTEDGTDATANTQAFDGSLFKETLGIRFATGGATETIGLMTVYSSSQVVLDRIAEPVAIILAKGAAEIVILSVAFLIVAQRLMLRPLERLTRQVQKIDFANIGEAHVDLGKRPEDELALLAQAFNTTFTKLHTARRSVVEANQLLAEEVEERKRIAEELEQSNTDLIRMKARLEEMVAERTHELASAQGFLAQLIETIPNSVFYKDRALAYLGYNDAFRRAFGIIGDEAVGRTSGHHLVNAEDVAAIEQDDMALIAHGGSRIYETTLHFADGQVHEVMISKAAIYDSATEERQGVVSVVVDITSHKRLEEELRRLATTDPLTGCRNRRFFLDQAHREISRANRYAQDLSLLMVDVDHFKQINDRHGHAVGDRTLQAFVHAIDELLRESDTLGRLGGEEFAVLLPGTPLDGALVLAERLRAVAAGLEIKEEGEEAVSFTVSLGVSTYRPGEDTVEALVDRADGALYQAKHKGRNKVEAEKPREKMATPPAANEAAAEPPSADAAS